LSIHFKPHLQDIHPHAHEYILTRPVVFMGPSGKRAVQPNGLVLGDHPWL
jgi:hypothetical protein